MRSQRPKVLHEVGGRPMLYWVLEAARKAGCDRLVVVIGHGGEEVQRAFADASDVLWVEQKEQRGTGHAVLQAREVVPPGPVLVLSGDVPLVSSSTLRQLLDAAAAGWGSLAIAELEQPGRLGRVLRRPDGGLERIVEAADASEQELAVTTINAGLYALPAPQVFEDLAALTPDNAQGEIYLPDAATAAVADGREVRLVTLEDPSEAWGVNDRRDLAVAHRRALDRAVEHAQNSGVTVLDPSSTVIQGEVEIGQDSVLHGDVTLLGNCRIGQRCVLHRGAWLRDVELGDEVEVRPYSVLDGAQVGSGSGVGPFARLRPGAELGRGVHIGNFVEVKKSRLADGVKAGHLTYLGDAEVGPEANIGAGTVTCNYDGRNKHRTVIGEGVFVGSGSMLVAPLNLGDGSYTGAGSTVTKDVPAGGLAVARGRQRNIDDWIERRRNQEKSQGEE